MQPPAKKTTRNYFDPHHPHDSLTKIAFGKPKVMADLLVGRMGVGTPYANWRASIDLNTLVDMGTNFVNKDDMKQSYADLLSTVVINEKVGRLHLEATTQLVGNELIRILGYGYEMASRDYEKSKETMPPVRISILLYTGRKGKRLAEKLANSIEIPEYLGDGLASHLLFIRLYNDSRQTMLRDGRAALVEILTKQAEQKEFYTFLKNDPEVLKLLVKSSYFKAAMLYTFAIDSNNREKIKDLVAKFAPHKRRTIMNGLIEIKNEGRAEGRAEGIQKGMQKGRAEGIQKGMQKGRTKGIEEGIVRTAKRMLSQLQLDIRTVQQASGLSRAELLRLQTA